MNRAIIVGSVIAGFAVLLSMSMMPANALPPENVCVKIGVLVFCNSVVVPGQHAMLISEPGIGDTSAGCHYVVSSLATVFWRFTLDHGPPECPEISTIIKSVVRVRGP